MIMKQFHSPLKILLLAFLSLTQRVDAAFSYWDINGATPGAGGPTPSGSWESANWTADSSGSSATTTWTDGDFPNFAAGSDATGTYVVTVNGNHTIAGMQMLTPSTVVVINGPGILSLADGQQGFFPNGATLGSSGLFINASLGGTGGLINQNASYLYLYGNNTYSGGTTFAANHITYYNNNNSFGTGPITNTATGGLSILTTNTLALAPNLPNDFWINNAGGVFNFGGGNTICSGHWYLQSPLQLKNNGANTSVLTISGPISEVNGVNGLSLLCPNSGKIVLSGANTFSGKTSIGTLAGGGNSIVSVSSLNSVNGGTPLLASSSLGCPATVANGTIDLGYTTFQATLIYTGSGETSDRVINLSSSTAAATIQADGTGPLVLTSDFTAIATTEGTKALILQGSSTAANAINGAIVDPSGFKTSLTKAQAGTWVLSGANTYSGNTTNSAGTLRQGAANVIPFGPGKGSFVIASGSKFDLGGFNSTINGTNSAGTIDNTTGTATFTIGNNGNGSAGSPTYSGVIQNTAPGVLNFVANCGGTLSLTSAGNTYSGNTTVNNAVLQITAENQLGTTPGSLVPNNIILDHNLGWNPTYATNSSNNYLRLQTTTTVDLTANRGIYLGNSLGYGGGIGAQSGKTLNVRGPISGPGGLWLGGGTPNAAVGTVALYNIANNYAGGTYVVGGTLTLGDNNVLPAGTPLTMCDGPAICNFDMNGKSQTIGPLTGFGFASTNWPVIKLSGALTIIQTNNTTFTGVINQAGGSLTLDASSTSTLTLGGTTNTYAYTGPTVINAGTLEIAAPNGVASTKVSVASGATLTLDSAKGLSATTALILKPGTPAVNLNMSGGTNTIGLLSFDGGATYAAPGIYGPVGSLAPNTDSRLNGNGYLNVGALSTTNVILSISNNANGTFTLNMLGTPGARYYLVSTNAVQAPISTWPAVSGSTNTALIPSGNWSFTVSNAAPAFYRSVAVSPAP
jgi:autotransporter-associated beta strand protein